MEKIDQIKADLRALLKIEDFKITHVNFMEITGRYSVAIETKIGDRLRVLHAQEHSIMDCATALQTTYDILNRAKYQTETFKLAEKCIKNK